ncbi:MAG TPA: flagellar export chaperone FliS [Gemmatimonadaceae bacterium]|nr:flagellar export chaperone FliS [Gemmatimonadaceae bacterium]
MSYSSYAHAATAYREREVLTASPARLVVMVYDHVIANLHRARVARDANKVDVRVEAISKAREGITELLVTLDIERGGALATQLQSLYTYMLTELVDGARLEGVRLERITKMVSELRDAFSTIATGAAQVPAA